MWGLGCLFFGGLGCGLFWARFAGHTLYYHHQCFAVNKDINTKLRFGTNL